MIYISNIFTDKDIKKDVNDEIEPSLSLNQGKQFKKYQRKIENNLVIKAEILSGKEGFSDIGSNSLTKKTNDIINNNNYTNQEQTIKNLRKEYQDTLKEYENLIANISGNVSGYIDRINPNNPYLNKNIKFTDGSICYVTNQGVVKPYTSWDIYVNTAGKNGCPPQGFIELNIPWKSEYTPGTKIPTTPPLIVGKPMKKGQSCGNEGSNVFVNELIDNPSISYVGCYNNNAPTSIISFVPVMNSSNSVNGYNSLASSVYQNNNIWGAWCAFNKNSDSFWHSNVSASNNYDSKTGNYTGSNGVTYKNKAGQFITTKGEFLQINLPGVNTTNPTSYPLVKYDIQGRQGCCGINNVSGRSPNSWLILGSNDGVWYQIDQRNNQNLNYNLRTYTISNPISCQAYIFLVTNCGSPDDKTGNRYCVQISQWNLYTTSNFTTSNPEPAMNNIGNFNFEQCKSIALNTDNKYFSINNINENGIGTCLVSKDLAQVQKYGEGQIFSPIPLWDTKTNLNGKIASLNNIGSLIVMNSSGQTVYSSPAKKANPSNYLGCYNDCYKGRGLPTYLGNGKNIETCSQAAKNGNWDYFGLQYTQPNGTSECWVGNDISRGMSMGKASNCSVVNNVNVGGGCSNAIYDAKNSTSKYFLILQDDGNMCVYRGTGPNDNQGFIWATRTTGKKQLANPNMAANNSQFGRNYIISGEQLLPNQFIGSNDGSIYLIMQTDGNLVLYTNNKTLGCSKKNNNDVGSNNINAVYQIDQYGMKNNMGKLAYIDADSNLHNYPDNNFEYNNIYKKIDGVNTPGNDIPGASFANTNLETCQKACDSNNNCAGFIFNIDGKYNNSCWPKTKSMFPFGGEVEPNPSLNLYVRSKIPKTPPFGVSQNTNNIDSIKYQNYINSGNIESKYGLPNINNLQKQQLEQLKTKMNLLSNQINKLTNKFKGGTFQAENQSEENVLGISSYLSDLKQTNKNIVNTSGENSGNIHNILQDSDIVVLQKNYDYLFWSILAAGTVLVSMNIAKNQ